MPSRETHDWNRVAGEVFVDPDAIRQGVRIDAQVLTGSYLYMDYSAFDAASAFTPALLPGQHFIYTSGFAG